MIVHLTLPCLYHVHSQYSVLLENAIKSECKNGRHLSEFCLGVKIWGSTIYLFLLGGGKSLGFNSYLFCWGGGKDLRVTTVFCFVGVKVWGSTQLFDMLGVKIWGLTQIFV